MESNPGPSARADESLVTSYSPPWRAEGNGGWGVRTDEVGVLYTARNRTCSVLCLRQSERLYSETSPRTGSLRRMRYNYLSVEEGQRNEKQTLMGTSLGMKRNKGREARNR